MNALPLVALVGLLASPPPAKKAFADGSPDASVIPRGHWARIAVPELEGFSSAKLKKAMDYVRTLATTGLMVAVHGRSLIEYGEVAQSSYVSGVRDSILGVLFGNPIASGKVRLDSTIGQLGIDDVGGLLPSEKNATVADLLTSRSGVYHPAANPGDDLAAAPARGSSPHGTHFLFSNWDFNALGTIFEKETGQPVYDAVDRELARPLGMEDFQLAQQRKARAPARSEHAAYHMWFSTRDLARVGLMLLRGGQWSGHQVVPSAWINAMTRTATAPEEVAASRAPQHRLGFGASWWVFDDAASRKGGPLQGAYTAVGAFGQFLTVIPKLDMVIAHETKPTLGKAVSESDYLRLVDMLIAARLEPAAPGTFPTASTEPLTQRM